MKWEEEGAAGVHEVGWEDTHFVRRRAKLARPDEMKSNRVECELRDEQG